MRQELERIVQEVSGLCGGAKGVVLPYPYNGGHLRLYTEENPDLGQDYTAQRRGGNLFVTISGARLLKALHEMDENTPGVCVDPQEGVFETLLYQLLKKGWGAAEADEPLLMRMALDLDEDAQRCANVLRNIQPLMHRAYAQALREGRETSVLTVIARQAVYHSKRQDQQVKETEKHS